MLIGKKNELNKYSMQLIKYINLNNKTLTYNSVYITI
jgi:hypothetical protein